MLAGVGCSDGGGEEAPAPDAGVLAYQACGEGTRVGGFSVDLAEKFTGVQGQVFDGVNPLTVLDTLAEDGECRHARAAVHFCDPACASGEACDAQGDCVPYPVAQDVGTVTVTGLLAPVEMEPTPPANFYTNPESLPHPGFEAGADIVLAAGGGVAEAFALRGWGIPALDPSDAEIVVQSGSALALAWDVPPAEAPTRVKILLIVNGHGGSGSRVECDVADAGSFTIPETLVTALVEDGLSGFPTIALTRSTADSADLALGCVEFRVQSERVLPVSVPGLVSCDGNEDCTPPEVCQTDLSCG
jgi:hypothetical protein